MTIGRIAWKLTLFGILLALSACSNGLGSEPEIGSAVGNLAPDITLNDGSGAEVSLSDYDGSVVLLIFSATWCGPCNSEASVAEAMYQSYVNDGFTIITVLVDASVSEAMCRQWSETYGLTFPVLADTDSTAWTTYYDEGSIPLNLLIDRDGVIRDRWVGFSSTGDDSGVRQRIEAIL